MTFLEAVEVYFRGEKHTGLALVPVGIAFAGAGYYFWRVYGGGLGKGFGIPLLFAGVLAIAGGGILWKTVDARQGRLTGAHAADPAAPVAEEVARMDKVNANWPVLKYSWAALTVIALGLMLFVARDWVRGVALAVIVLCAVALVIDTFAERRAHIYSERIARPT
jgi:hypothetical protein